MEPSCDSLFSKPVASSFNGRTVGSEPINRGSNPWEATNSAIIRSSSDFSHAANLAKSLGYAGLVP